MDYYDEGITIHGAKIVAEARKIIGPVVIVKTGRHKAQRIVLIENADATIERKVKWAK